MSVEKHLEAMEIWGRLSNMESADARKKALDDESEMNATWATAGVSAMVLKSLGMDYANVDETLWTKIYGRPVAKVYAFYLKAKSEKPEQRVRLLSAFASRVKPLPGAVDDLPEDVARDVRGAA